MLEYHQKIEKAAPISLLSWPIDSWARIAADIRPQENAGYEQQNDTGNTQMIGQRLSEDPRRQP